MIVRIWHGWTAPENADQYERLVKQEVFQKIEEKQIPGYQGLQLVRKDHQNETEFISMIWFDRLEDVTAFAGADYETAHVPVACEKVLKRYDQKVVHYEVRHQLTSP